MHLTQNLVHDFQLFNNSTAGRQAARRLAALHPALADVTRPSDAIAILRAAEAGRHRDLLNALIAASPTDTVAARVILQSYLPAMLRPRRMIEFHDVEEREEFITELVAITLAVIAELANEPPSEFPGTRIARAIDNATRRWKVDQAARAELFEEITDDANGTILLDDPSDARGRDIDLLLGLIVGAANAGRITREEATFTLRTILADDTPIDEAKRRYVCLRAVQKAHKRTTDAIVGYALAKVA